MADRVATYKGTVGTFDTIGTTSAAFDVVTIFNRATSGVLVAIHRIDAVTDHAAGTTTLRTLTLSRLTTNPTAGTLLTPVPFDTALTHQALVEVRGAASVDAGASIALATATTTTSRLFLTRNIAAQTGQGQQISRLVAPPEMDDPFILAEGQGLVVELLEASQATLHHIVNIAFEEFNYAVEGGQPVYENRTYPQILPQ